MDTSAPSLTERLAARLRLLFREDRVPFLAALLAGLLAHGYAFANKLLNADELSSLFGKGATVGSGRWGLPLTSYLFPDLSMPWVYGLLSLVLLAAATALIARIFQIRRPLVQALLAATVVCFPAQTATFSYMFTSPSYALAFLLAVASAAIVERGGWRCQILGGLCLVLSLGIFQGYIALVASFFLIGMIRRLMAGEDARAVLLHGLSRLLWLAVALVLYYALALLFLKIYGWHFEPYGVERERSLLLRVLVAYSSFLRIFTRGYFGFIRTPFATVLHGLCVLAMLGGFVPWLLRERDWGRRGLALLCLFLLPLSINCLYLIANVDIIGPHVLYGFVAFYVLAAVLTEDLRPGPSTLLRDCVLVALALITAGNVYFANKCYLKMHLDYENAYALYTGIAAQVRDREEFQPGCVLALVGRADQGLVSNKDMDLGEFSGPSWDLVNVYTREILLRRYVGFDVPMASGAEVRALAEDPRVIEMPSYPYYGCIQRIDGYLVVKLGE
ncbi:MAG: glucosyltransferase domain-containing protein [Oscillospiraceae bacterium]|nr:glucosyltransferase domain-containing protein [Oscillospiraceae bacterium]